MKRHTLRLTLAVTLVALLIGCHDARPAVTPSVLVPLPSTRQVATVDSLGELKNTPKADVPANLKPEAFDYKALLGDYPADDSPEHAAELQLLLKLQAERTSADEARCQKEVAVTVFAFANELGPWFADADLPITRKLMHDAGQVAKQVSGGGKKLWSRVRPPLADPRIHLCVPLEMTFSYPSGHATIGAFWATLLAEMFPADREILLARGDQIGFDRNIAGIHWPTDVIAGEKLGREIARRMLADPAFVAKLDQAKAECMQAMKRH